MNIVKFWNGNKSPARQAYELELLRLCLLGDETNGSLLKIEVDNTDYPSAVDEGNIFSKGCDVLVTVAGNVKFANKDKIEINQPICMGLLGCRALVIRSEDSALFASISSAPTLQKLSAGIPATWADAELFRHNGYKVVEKGSLNDIFSRLKNHQCDYVALGAIEIDDLYAQFGYPLGSLQIESTLLLYYPLPLVFYVNPQRASLAKQLQLGLTAIMQNGQHQHLFNKHFGEVLEGLALSSRTLISLENANLPASLQNFRPSTLFD